MFLWAIDSLFIAHCFYLLFIVSLLICACCCGFCGNKRFLTACFYINAQWMSFTLYIWCSLIGVWCIFCIFVCYFSSFLIFSLSRLGREAVVFGIFVILNFLTTKDTWIGLVLADSGIFYIFVYNVVDELYVLLLLRLWQFFSWNISKRLNIVN
jgi:hypothetical protein